MGESRFLKRLRNRLSRRPDTLSSPQEGPEDSPESFSPENQLCPAYEDFGADATSLFNLDLIEGCRLVLTSQLGRGTSTSETPAGPSGETILSYTLNLGTYPKPGTQADILRALLNPSAGGVDSASKGGSSWSTLLRWSSASGRESALARYASRNGFVDGRAIWKVADSVTLRGSVVSPGFFSHLGVLAKSCWRPKQLKEAWQGLDVSNDMCSLVMERHTSGSNMTAQVSYQESPIYKLSYAHRLARSLTLGADLTMLSGNGALVTTYGFRWMQGKSIVSGLLSASPNFSKPMTEGLKERVYGIRATLAHKVTDRIALSGEIEVPLGDLRRTVGRLGYEVQFAQARVMGNIDTDLKLQTTVEDIAGLQLAGEMDFANDNYKFGFGFELVPQRRAN